MQYDEVAEINQTEFVDLGYQKLILDINQIPITENGIPYFYWPINPFEINHAYFSLVKEAVKIIREAINAETPGTDLAIILYLHFLHEVICAYQAGLLIQRARQEGYTILPSSRSRLVDPLLKGEMPRLTGIIQTLRNGPSKAKWWRFPIRIMRDILIGFKEGMRRRTLFPVRYKKNIISMTVDVMATRYVKSVTKRVIYRRLDTWFRKLRRGKINSASYVDMQNRLMKVPKALFNKNLNELSPLLESYMSRWLNEAFTLTDCYWEQLQRRPRKIPHHLWTITAGDIWGRILARSVRKNGGRVTRFTHGSGCGFLAHPFEQGHYEFEDCTEYVTFSEAQNKAFREAFTKEDTVQINPPDFNRAASGKNLFKVSKNVSKKQRKKKQCIMYVASVYPGEHVYTATQGLMSDVVMLDWEVRLLKKLKSWNFDIILKPHPAESNCINAPKSIEYQLGSIIVNELLENVLHRADIILFDNPASTITSTLVLSEKPLVYLDFRAVQFTPEARGQLNKRCPIVEGWYDDKNRAQINWFDLRKAVLTCDQYTDPGFAESYFRRKTHD